MPSTASQLGIKEPSKGFLDLGWYPSASGGSFQYKGGTFGESGAIHPDSPQQGAGKAVSREVVNQSDPLKGQATGTDWDYLHSGKNQTPSSQNEVTPFLNNFQQSAFAADSAVPTKTRSMEQVKAMLTPDMAKPEQFSSVAEFNKLREDQGVAGLEEKNNDIKGQIDEVAAELRQQKTAQRGIGLTTDVVQGRIGEFERQASERMDYLGRQQARITDQLQTSYSVINMMMGFMEGDYNRASAAYNAEFSNNLKVYDIVRGEERDARSDFESDRANASANLTTYMNAVTSGSMSFDNLDSNQKLMINKLEIQSGMPVGFVSRLQMKPGDRMLQFNEKTGEALMVGANGKLEVHQTGMRPSPSTGSGTVTDSKAEQAQFKTDASVDTTTFSSLVESYAKKGMSLDEIYAAWSNSENGRKFGDPKEDSQIIRLTYKVARGEMTEEEALAELES